MSNISLIKWEQVFQILVSSTTKFSISGRITIDHNPTENATKLNIKSVQVHDEEIYKCTITYVDPRETCDSFDSYSIQLNVLGKL